MDFRASNLPADALIRYAGATVTEQAFTTGIDHRFGVALFVGKAHGLGALLELSDNLLQGINGGQVGTSQLRYVQSTQPRYDTGRNVWWMELQFQAIQH